MEGVRFTLQGLSVFMNNAGHLLVQGTQTDFTKPIFLSTEHPIILDNVRASALQITAPRIITIGISTIDTLRVEGQRSAEHESAVFVNAGQLTAREFFLKNLKGQNTGGIAATRFAVDGQLASSGSIYSSELILEEAAFLRLSETSRADIKTLFLSEASHFETFETTNAVSIGVLDSLGGSLTNHGSLMIDEIAVDSALQAITNRHFLDIALGSIQVQQFENHGTLDAGQSDIQVTDGQNLGALKTKSLQVVTAFTNTSSGVIETSLVSGSGHLRNLGGIETQGDLSIGIKRFSNSGQTVGQSIEGASTLEQVDNMQDGVIEATGGLRFTDVTQVNNLGALRSEEMALYSDKTLQKGELTARKLNLLGQAFLNQGEIEVDYFTAENGLINEAILATFRSTDFGAGGLTNRVKATTKLRGLGLSGDTAITNHGKLKIEGVDTALGVLHITNTGGATATIDAEQILPKASEGDPENSARIAAILPIDAEFIVRGEEARTDAIEDRALLAYQQIQRIPINPIITQWNASVFYSMLADQHAYEAQDIVIFGTGIVKAESVADGIKELQNRQIAGDSIAATLLSTMSTATFYARLELVTEYNKQAHIRKQAYAAGFKREDYANFEEFEAALKKRNWESCLLLNPTEFPTFWGTGRAKSPSLQAALTEMQRRKDAGDLVAKNLLEAMPSSTLENKEIHFKRVNF